MIAHLNGTVAGVGLDGAVIDVGGVGLRVQCTQTIMRSPDDKAALAREVLALAAPDLLKDNPGARVDSRP